MLVTLLPRTALRLTARRYTAVRMTSGTNTCQVQKLAAARQMRMETPVTREMTMMASHLMTVADCGQAASHLMTILMLDLQLNDSDEDGEEVAAAAAGTSVAPSSGRMSLQTALYILVIVFGVASLLFIGNCILFVLRWRPRGGPECRCSVTAARDPSWHRQTHGRCRVSRADKQSQQPTGDACLLNHSRSHPSRPDQPQQQRRVHLPRLRVQRPLHCSLRYWRLCVGG